MPKPLWSAPCAADNDPAMDGPDWREIDLEALAAELRATLPAGEAEKMIWAFERALEVARIDGDLVRYRSVSDDEWRSRYAPLLT